MIELILLLYIYILNFLFIIIVRHRIYTFKLFYFNHTIHINKIPLKDIDSIYVIVNVILNTIKYVIAK